MERELQIKGAGHLFLGSSGENTQTVDPLYADSTEQSVTLPDTSNLVNVDQALHVSSAPLGICS